MTKGELYLYDQELSKKLQPESMRELVKQKLVEEIFIVKNIFADPREYEYNPDYYEQEDIKYTKMKRTIKSPDALKKFNNLNMTEQIYQEYVYNLRTTEKKEELKMDPEVRKFFNNEDYYFKKEFATRLPFKSYHRMARDLFVYP